MLNINKIENCYGMQGNKYVYQTLFERRNSSIKTNPINLNFIYGVNMSGKSSLVRVFKSLKSNSSIENKRSTDGFPNVDMEINKSRITYTSGKWDFSSFQNDNLYIYDKQFVNENYTIIEKVGYIGKNANEYYEMLDKMTLLKIKPNDIKKAAQKISHINNKGDFKGFGTTMKFTLFYSNGETPFNTLIDLYEKQNQRHFSLSSEIYQNNHDLLKHEKIDLTIIDKVTNKIESFSVKLGEKYKIRTLDSLNFYQTVKNYLLNNKIDECPICLRSFDDVSKVDIINQIENEIRDFIRNEDFRSVLSSLQEYNNIDSEYARDFKYIIHRLTSEEDYVSLEEITQFKAKVNIFYDEVDDYLVSLIMNLYASNINQYIQIRNNKEIIYNENKKVTNSYLLNEFNKLLKISSFPLANIIEATLDENQPFIKISIKDSQDSLRNYFTTNASEGEKSLLSILYYFSIVLTSNKIPDDIICIIDDPIDSHNNQNKYLIMDFISNNLISNNLFNLIFTHSAEVIKFSRNLVRLNTKIYLLTNEHKNGLFELHPQHHKVFDGLYEFFKGVVTNKSTDNITFKAVALMVVLRDYINQTKIFTDELICKDSSGNFINNLLFKELSNRAIHYNISDDFMTIEELVNIYKKYIQEYKIPNSVLADYEKNKKLKINQYISRRLVHKEYEIENLSMNIMLKNLWALHIRTNMEKAIYDFAVKSLSSKSKIKLFIEEYQEADNYQLGAKLKLVETKYKSFFNRDYILKWDMLYLTIAKQKPIINNFHHLANSYITPMFEIKISELEEYFDKLMETVKVVLT